MQPRETRFLMTIRDVLLKVSRISAAVNALQLIQHVSANWCLLLGLMLRRKSATMTACSTQCRELCKFGILLAKCSRTFLNHLTEDFWTKTECEAAIQIAWGVSSPADAQDFQAVTTVMILSWPNLLSHVVPIGTSTGSSECSLECNSCEVWLQEGLDKVRRNYLPLRRISTRFCCFWSHARRRGMQCYNQSLQELNVHSTVRRSCFNMLLDYDPCCSY